MFKFNLKILIGGIFGALLFFFSAQALAECSDRKIGRLSQAGKDLEEIAQECDMDEDDVDEVLKKLAAISPGIKSKGAKRGGSNLLVPGTPLSQCGCWGPDNGSAKPNGLCQSGFAQAQICPAMCASGGYAWQGVCQ